jgi:malate dehydrogenase
MGTSAWYAPGAAAAQMVESILKNENRIYPCCALLNGEYNQQGVFVGVPVKLGANGIEQLIELKLNESEMALLNDSADQVRQVMEVYDGLSK